MSTETRHRPAQARRTRNRLARWVVEGLWPNQHLRWTREGIYYLGVWVGLLVVGLYQQINLILLVAGLAAGPVVASVFVSAAMLRRLRVSRRVPAYVFSGDPLRLDYTLHNDRRWTAALALNLQDDLAPSDRAVAGAAGLQPQIFFPRVPGQDRARIRWEGPSPRRGRYEFRNLDLATRSPFGLFERSVTITSPGGLVVYPMIGQLTRRWHLVEREASETRRGQRHERAITQQEYHGLRDYRPGDSPRWIHWRTSARLGQPMVKEFEQQHEQDLAILIDPWLPRTKVTAEQREAVEEAIKFVATLCFETCRQAGRRLVLGWTGAAPGLRQGPSSIKLLHELLEQLALMRPATEGGLATLLDALPPSTLREAVFVVVSTRPINLHEEAEKTARLAGASSRGMLGRVTLLDASRGDLAELVKYGETAELFASPRPESESSDRLTRVSRDGRPPEPVPAAGAGEIPPGDGLVRRIGGPLMNFRTTYRASTYVMIFFATLVLSVDMSDHNRLALLYPVVTAVAGAAAYLTVDRRPQLALSVYTANLLGLASIGAAFFEYWYDESLSLLALGHFFVYLQLILFFQPKSTRGDWYLFVIGLVQVLLGGVMSQSDVVGMALFAWALCSLWVLALFTLSREAERNGPSPGTTLTPAIDPESPYPSLIDTQFLLASARVAAMTLALGGVIFLFMPRQQAAGTTIRTDVLGQHLTGFDDEVQLGQLGEILENESVVMTIDLTSYPDGTRVMPDPEQLWRGVALARYERGRWKKMMWRASTFPPDTADVRSPHPMIRQQIKIEPTDNPILFGIRPILWADSANKRLPPEFNPGDGSIHRGDSRPISVEYVVISSTDPDQLQPREAFPTPQAHDDLLSIPADLKAQLRPIAEARLAGVDRRDRAAVARRLSDYLNDPREFGYTLQMDVVDSSIDPVADFLLNRKEGHCEYFASALTLLLRSVNIPARMVNGFKGGDYNDLAGVVNVREKHAHTWCEVLLADRRTPENALPRWLTVDPTPANERDRSVAQVGGLFGGFRQVTDFVRYVWTFYVVGFNGERQQRFLYEPIRRLFAEARRGFEIMYGWLRQLAAWLFHFRDVSSFISWRGFVGTFVVLAFVAGLAWSVRFAMRRLRRIWDAARADESALAAGVIFYRRLAALLAEFGLERPPAETPREFARRAAGFLAAHGSGNESLADVPPLVVDAYYRIRFGHLDLDTDILRLVENRLDALEARLRPSAS